MGRAAPAALLAALALAPSAGAADGPTLRVVATTPLVLAGRGFGAGETVRVTVATGYGARVQRVVAVRGGFKVTFRALPAAGCGAPYLARAVGARGSRAVLALGKPAFCIPPPRD